MLSRAATLTAAVLAVAAPSASAATVTLTTSQSGAGPHGSIDTYADARVVAGPGERNVLTVRAEPVSATYAVIAALTVSDSGGTPLTAGTGCVAQPDGSVRCTVPPGAQALGADVEAGDGDDDVTVDGVRGQFSLDGGSGDDVLRCGPDTLSCGLLGGDGDDVLAGGPGHDGLDGGAGADRLEGGGGIDAVSYAHRTAPVTATIGAGGGGEAGEGDAIGGDVEHLTGGAGDAHLGGDAGPNAIYGGDGADVLDGGGGDDHLVAGDTYLGSSPTSRPAPTAHVLLGGDGDDELELIDGGMAFGGPGADRLATAGGGMMAGGPGRDAFTPDEHGWQRAVIEAADDGDGADTVRCSATPPSHVVLGPGDVSLGCRGAVHRQGTLPGALAALTGVGLPFGPGMTWVHVGCADDARGGCAARATVLDEHGHAVGHGRVRHRVRPGYIGDIRVDFTKAYTRRQRREHALPVTYIVSMRDTRGVVRTDGLPTCQLADPFVSESCP